MCSLPNFSNHFIKTFGKALEKLGQLSRIFLMETREENHAEPPDPSPCATYFSIQGIQNSTLTHPPTLPPVLSIHKNLLNLFSFSWLFQNVIAFLIFSQYSINYTALKCKRNFASSGTIFRSTSRAPLET